MTHRTPDIERSLEHWLADGPTSMPDRVVDVIADRISGQPQRRHWRPFGSPPMSTFAKPLAAIAAAIVLAVAAWQLLPRTPGPGSDPTLAPPTTPAPTTATPSSRPTPAASPTLAPIAGYPAADGTLAGGRYGLSPLDPPSTLKLTAEVPAGWQGHGGWALTSPAGASTEGILISFMAPDGLFSDGCQWDLDGSQLAEVGDVAVGPTVDDLIAALRANTSYTSTAPSPVQLDGIDGQQIELQLPGESVIQACDRRPGESVGDFFVFPKGFYAQGWNNVWHLYVVDVAGTRLVTMLSQEEGASEEAVAAGEAVVASFDFAP